MSALLPLTTVMTMGIVEVKEGSSVAHQKGNENRGKMIWKANDSGDHTGKLIPSLPLVATLTVDPSMMATVSARHGCLACAAFVGDGRYLRKQ